MIISYLVDSQEFQKYEDKFSSFRFCGKFSEFFFFFMESSFLFLLEHMARRAKKYIHTTKETRLRWQFWSRYFIDLHCFHFHTHRLFFSFRLRKNNLYSFNKTIYPNIEIYICQTKIFFRLLNVIITFREDVLHTRNANMHEFLQAKYSCSISFRLNKFVYLLFFLFFTFKSLLMRFLYRIHQ